MDEVQKTIEFVREQRRHARNPKHWKRRLSMFGFGIDESDDGPVITQLPRRKVVCAVPQDLLV